MASRRLSIAVKLAAIAVFAVVSLELGLRARIAFQSHHKFEDGRLFRYLPNTQVGGSPELTTNALGFFGEDMPLSKPEGQLRIAILGSSAVTSPQLAQSLQSHLENNLRRDVVVNTVGIPRYTSYHNALLAERYLKDLDLDFAIFYGGINDNVYNTFPSFAPAPYDGFVDAHRFSQSVIYALAYDKVYLKRSVAQRVFEPGLSVDQLKSNLARVADAVDGEVVLVPIAVGWPTGDEDLASVVNTNEGPMSHFWGTRESALKGLEAHREVMRELADTREDVAFTEVADKLGQDSHTFHDLCHLTPEGIDTLANALGGEIVRLLDAE